jgi:hypothetical protein
MFLDTTGRMAMVALPDKSEVDTMLTTLFPLGKARWIKVQYLDFEKRKKAFRIFADESYDQEMGYSIEAISVRKEHLPQVTALMDLRDEITVLFLQGGGLDNAQLNIICQLFKTKINEVMSAAVREKEIKGQSQQASAQEST